MSDLPPGFVLDGGAATLPQGFVLDGTPEQSAPAQMATGILNTLPAAEQGSAPSASYYGAPISSQIYQNDAGEVQYKDPKTGDLKTTDSATQVVLRDPTDGQLKVYARSPSTNEGALTGLARVLGLGLGASEPAQAAVMRAGKLPLSKAPTIGELSDAKTAAYNAPEVTSLRLRPQAVKRLAQGADQSLLANKVDSYLAPYVSTVTERLQSPRFGGAHTIADLDLARQSLSNAPPAESRAAGIVRSLIDDYLGNVPQRDVLMGNAAAANSKLLEARGNNAAMERALEVQRALHNADVQSGSTYSGGNLNNAMRQQLRPLLKAKKGQFRPDAVDNGFVPKGMNADEAQQLARAVLGTKTGNAARMIGKMGPTGGMMGLGHFGMAMATGGKSIPLSIGTIVSRMIGNASTARQIQILNQMLRMRSPLAESMAQSNLVAAPSYAPSLLSALSPRVPALLDFGVVAPAPAQNRQQ